LALAKYLVNEIPRFDPSRPDSIETFQIPASPRTTDVKPLGNWCSILQVVVNSRRRVLQFRSRSQQLTTNWRKLWSDQAIQYHAR